MPRSITEETKEAIRLMSLKKLTQGEIAEKLGVSKGTVRKYQANDSIPASNRYRGGVISSKYDETLVKVDTTQKEESKREYVVVADKVVTLTGYSTGFIYTIGARKTSVDITTNNEQDIKIDLKSLVAFGNEILDVAEKIELLRKDMFSV